MEADFEISYPTASSEIFDFVEVVRDSGLENRCSPERKEELRKVLEKHKKFSQVIRAVSTLWSMIQNLLQRNRSEISPIEHLLGKPKF